MNPHDIVSVMCHPSHAEAPFPKGVIQQAFITDFLGHADAGFKRQILWDESQELAKLLEPEQLLTLRLGPERRYSLSPDGVFLHYVAQPLPLEEVIDQVFRQTGLLSADFARDHLTKLRDMQRRVRFAREKSEQVQVNYRVDWLPPETQQMLAARDLAGLLKLCQRRRTGLFGLWG